MKRNESRFSDTGTSVRVTILSPLRSRSTCRGAPHSAKSMRSPGPPSGEAAGSTATRSRRSPASAAEATGAYLPSRSSAARESAYFWKSSRMARSLSVSFPLRSSSARASAEVAAAAPG